MLILQVLPLAHTSGSNRDEVQLVNPQAVNLKAYEAKLEDAIKLYTRYMCTLSTTLFHGACVPTVYVIKSTLNMYLPNHIVTCIMLMYVLIYVHY